jgi:hypothetical protein
MCLLRWNLDHRRKQLGSEATLCPTFLGVVSLQHMDRLTDRILWQLHKVHIGLMHCSAIQIQTKESTSKVSPTPLICTGLLAVEVAKLLNHTRDHLPRRLSF